MCFFNISRILITFGANAVLCDGNTIEVFDFVGKRLESQSEKSLWDGAAALTALNFRSTEKKTKNII